jgi:FlaA1/EpsC-like NDP-sugar epimerase
MTIPEACQLVEAGAIRGEIYIFDMGPVKIIDLARKMINPDLSLIRTS